MIFFPEESLEEVMEVPGGWAEKNKFNTMNRTRISYSLLMHCLHLY